MSSETSHARSVFLSAVEKHSPDQWPSFLDEACADDPSLRAEVEELLSAHQSLGTFHEESGPDIAATFLSAAATEAPGTEIGPYKIREKLGEGGMGVVYVADQKEPIRRRVALKIIKAGMDSEEVIARFSAERQALALMSHPNIARVLDGGATENGRPYFVMELVRGVPITEFCDEQKLTIRERLELFVTVCQAVQHAHLKGIIHRDLKPGNVLVELHDAIPVPKVIDFGVAKATNQQLTQQTVYTHFAQLVGTPLYMSPEQAQLSGLDIDTRSDVYSLGVLLYELLTGTTPFDRETLSRVGLDEMRRIIREDDPPRPSDKVSTLQVAQLSTTSERRRSDPRELSISMRRELDWIVMRALEKDRSRRYESASDLAQDIQRYLNNEPVEACPPSTTYRFRKFARRHRGRLAVAGALTIALLIAFTSFGWAVRDREVREAENAAKVMARQERVNGQIELILAEAETQVREQKWQEAGATLRRSEALIASEDADPSLKTSVQQLVTDVKMVRQLEEIGEQRTAWREDGFDHQSTTRAYAEAFRSYGIDVENLPEQEAARCIAEHENVRIPLSIALDHWAIMQREIDRTDTTPWKRLFEIAMLADPDPVRNKLRRLSTQDVTSEQRQELIDLCAYEVLRDQGPVTIRQLAIVLWNNFMCDYAIDVMATGQNLYPRDFWIAFDLSILHSRVIPPQLREAESQSRIALAIRPDSYAAHINLGSVLSDLQRNEECIAIYRKAMEIDPRSRFAYHNLVVSLEKLDRFEEALEVNTQAIEVIPDSATFHRFQANLFMKLGRVDEAVDSLRTATSLDPQDFSAHWNLAERLREKGVVDEAIEHYSKALDLDSPGAGSLNVREVYDDPEYRSLIPHVRFELMLEQKLHASFVRQEIWVRETPQPVWWARGQNRENLDAYIPSLAEGSRLTFLSAIQHSKVTTTFVTIWTRDDREHRIETALTRQEFEELLQMRADGMQLISVEEYVDGETTLYAASWVEQSTPAPWELYERLSESETLELAQSMMGRGFRPTYVNAYPDGTLTTIWVQDDGESELLLGLTYQDLRDLERLRADDCLPICIDSYFDGQRRRYSLVIDESAQHVEWKFTLLEVESEFQSLFDEHGKAGWRPIATTESLVGSSDEAAK